MSDAFDGGAPAPAESTAAPAEMETVSPPNPISTELVAAEPEAKPAKTPSIDEALKNAAAKVEKTSAEEGKDKPAPVKSDGPGRDEKGKFAGSEPKLEANVAETPVKQETAKPAPVATPANDAPARFSPDAKAAWADAPDAVKAETNRAIKEMEAGIEKHRAAAEAYEEIREFDELAKLHKTTVKQAMTQYTTLEKTLMADPLKGIEEVCNYVGLSLRDVAAHVLGQPVDQRQSQADRTIIGLQQELATLKQQIGSVNQTFEQQKADRVMSDIQSFAADKPRFDELAGTIAKLISTNMAADLKEAYEMAERLSPAPVAAEPSPAAPAAAGTDLLAQTQRGSKSISGAPGTGSDPARKSPPKSIDDALKSAFAALG